MKKYLLPALTIFVAVASFSSCSDDNDKVWVTEAPEIGININDATYTSLTFEWESVKVVNQYGYELTGPDGSITARGVTDDTTVTFTGLQPSTTYTLTVYIYGAEGTVTRRIVLTATTGTVVKLSSPEVTATANGARIDVNWTPVENAGYYHYSYLLDGTEVSGDTEECALQLRALPVGQYTISVTAIASDERFADSDAVNCTFSRIRNEIWNVKGIYMSSLLRSGNSWESTLTAFDDGSYVLSDWYGVPGYDLEFTVNNDYSLEIESGTTDTRGYCLVESGNMSVPTVSIWPYSDEYGIYSAFDGTQEYGTIWYYVTDGAYGYGYDTFDWGDDEPTEPDTPSDIDLSGRYNVTGWSGLECYWFTSTGYWNEFAYNNFEVEVTQNGNNITLSGFLGGDGAITGTVDYDAKTITFPAQDVNIGGYYYRFAFERYDLWDIFDSSVVNDALIATFDDNLNIDMSGYGLYYVYDDGSLYVYFSGVVQQMSKIKE